MASTYRFLHIQIAIATIREWKVLLSDRFQPAPDVWLKNYGILPEYYITKQEATEKYGWNSRRNTVAGKAPGKMIGGDVYFNDKSILPEADGRVWYECDVDYENGTRASARLFYSSDGLMFYSPDHLAGEVTVYLVE